jgi:putative membrane protein
MRRFPLICAASVLSLAACQKNVGNTDAANSAETNMDMANTGVAMNNETAPTTAIDAAFVTDAMKGDNGEVAIGKLAAAKASSQASKDFGNLLVTDHGAHKTKLVALASSAGVPATDEPSDEAKKTLDKLNKLSGAEFDKAFKSAMIEDHNKDIAKYEKQASSGDQQTAALAKETLPTLRKHLQAANAL